MFKFIFVVIGLCYLCVKCCNGFIFFILMVLILGIVFGVMVLIIILVVMSGFQKEICSCLLQMIVYIIISCDGELMLDWMWVVDVVKKDSWVVGVVLYIEIQLMISGLCVQGVVIQGIDLVLELNVLVIDKKVIKGSYDSFKLGSFNLLLGKELVIWLGVDVGDQVLVIFVEVQGMLVGVVSWMKCFIVSGFFEVGYNEVDCGVGFVNMQDLECVLCSDGVIGVWLKLYDMDCLLEVGVDLVQSFGGVYCVSDWMQQNVNFYYLLCMEKVVMGILLLLIIVMGVFNLVFLQVMLVIDKQVDIVILCMLGLILGGVMQVFMVQGLLIGIFGMLVGLIGGIILIFNLECIFGVIESVFNVKFLLEDVYYIIGLLIDMQIGDVVVIIVVVLLMSFLVILYFVWWVVCIQLVEVLCYE